MGLNPSHWDVRIGQAVVVLLVGLVVVAIILKGPWPSDGVYLLVRWPIWVVGLILLPAAVLRIVFWHRHGPGAH